MDLLNLSSDYDEEIRKLEELNEKLKAEAEIDTVSYFQMLDEGFKAREILVNDIGYSKEEVDEFIAKHNLNYIDTSSNAQEIFIMRNFLMAKNKKRYTTVLKVENP